MVDGGWEVQGEVRRVELGQRAAERMANLSGVRGEMAGCVGRDEGGYGHT